jgi:hypothetical protein
MLSKLDELWPSIIQKIDFDIVGHQIRAVIGAQVDATSGLHELVFDEVTAIYWVEKSSSYRKARESANYLPLEGIYYRPGKIQEVILRENDQKGRPNFDTFPNFLLEIWDQTLLFIEAYAVIIDGKRFEVPKRIPFIPYESYKR